MLNKSNLLLQSVFLCLILIVISGCSGLNENPAGNTNSERGVSDEPVAIIDFPYDLPDEDPIISDDPVEPVELVQGNYVSFYTWQSDGSLVTNEQYHEEYNELVHPWDDNTLTIDEFLSLYDPNGDIELTCEEPCDGLIVCEPYQVNRNELMNLDEMVPDLAALITPEMTISEAHDELIAYHRMNGIEDRK
ncbi:hypothetical protein J7L05_09470 [bacterium]|nr:hypothetical protein [bacterium]